VITSSTNTSTGANSNHGRGEEGNAEEKGEVTMRRDSSLVRHIVGRWTGALGSGPLVRSHPRHPIHGCKVIPCKVVLSKGKDVKKEGINIGWNLSSIQRLR
jgi:hypothetical protein